MSRHKTTRRSGDYAKTIATGIIALIIAAVIAAGVCCMGYASRGDNNKWFGNFKNISTWHWTDKTDGEPGEGDGNNPGKPGLPTVDGRTKDSLFQVTPIETNNKLMRMTAEAEAPENSGLSTQAENSVYTLTASIDPFETTDQTVSWTMEWANPSSTWASGKIVADYVEMNIPEEGAKTVTLKAKQAFSERIKAIATSNSNPDATAYCVLDYARRATGFSETAYLGADLQISGDRFLYKCSTTSGFTENGGNIGKFLGLSYGVGTYNDEYKVKITYRPELAFINAVWGLKTVEYGVSIEFNDANSGFTVPISGGDLGYGRYFLLTGVGSTLDSSALRAYPSVASNTAVQYLLNNPETAIGTITLECTGKYSNLTKTYFVYADTDSLAVVAENLGLSDSNIVM